MPRRSLENQLISGLPGRDADLARGTWPQSGGHGVFEQAALDFANGGSQLLDGAVLDGLVAETHAALALGQCGFKRIELGLGIGHQRYTTRLISVESANDVAIVAQETSTYSAVFWSALARAIAMRCVPLSVLLRASATQQ